METEVQTTSTPPQKFSRYRSVRIAALKAAPAPLVPALPSNTAGNEVRNEPSRYKHKRPASGLPGTEQHADLFHIEGSSINALRSERAGHQSLEETASSKANRTRLPETQDFEGPTTQPRMLIVNAEEESASRRLPGHAADSTVPQPSDAQHQYTHNSEELEKLTARRSYNDAQREAYAILNGKVDWEGNLHREQRDSSQRIKQSARKQEGMQTDHPWRATGGKTGEMKDVNKETFTARTVADVAAFKHDQIPFSSSEKGTRNNLPGIDAPVSAVNAGERNVRVKFNKSSIVVPIINSTTVDDVLHFAAESFTDSFDISSAVLLESFKQLGLERPLRRYEPVREILNSWDHDNQNSLLIVQSFTAAGGNHLNIASVPARRPEATSVNIHHSQKPGIWDKRQITLHENGQITLAKSAGETTNICHMSDFDLYTPTHRQIKKLNPPKKMCFAIKSQQKSAMFLTTANFVHFFSTKDKVIAETWYEAVQNWRSWYLVHVMGNGPKKLIPQSTPTSGIDRLSTEKGMKHERRISQKLSSHPIHSPKPAEARKDAVADLRTKLVILPHATTPIETTQRSRPLREHATPPVSFPKHFATISDIEPLATLIKGPGCSSQSQVHGKPTAFSASIGRRPSQRIGAPHTQPICTAPEKRSNGLYRSTSQRRKPAPLTKPLIDLTPEFQEPPQFIKRGRGITVSRIPEGGLVNIATSPEMAVPLPPTAVLQRPGTAYAKDSGVPRTMATRAPAPHATSPLPRSEMQEAAFMMGGLLAQASVRQEGRRSAKGAKTGDREGREPMLDVAESSVYVPGSLLAGVERQAGSSGPTIDREKKVEVLTSTGECL
ncbi:hypothetical protein MMC11_005442 [Xylographa trunciseda]|nr:hypothetical protein [Xylographa trunciseda]